ncbi:hypothetical protein KIW84_043172 [Lathyrus oleraceus]|uniref:Uncharacterized protein n=1 Tax=Pisum sativum TaxID=3888 RepID=A0A9D4XD45_PEA|nr:hypothetical protein KIW84_043172 [Pisum sativum]
MHDLKVSYMNVWKLRLKELFDSIPTLDELEGLQQVMGHLSNLLDTALKFSLSSSSRPPQMFSPLQKILWTLNTWTSMYAVNMKIASFILEIWFNWHESLWACFPNFVKNFSNIEDHEKAHMLSRSLGYNVSSVECPCPICGIAIIMGNIFLNFLCLALVPVVVGTGFEMGRVTKGLLHTSSAGFAAVVGLLHTALPSSFVTVEFDDCRIIQYLISGCQFCYRVLTHDLLVGWKWIVLARLQTKIGFCRWMLSCHAYCRLNGLVPS